MVKIEEEIAFLGERVKHWRAGRDEAMEDISSARRREPFPSIVQFRPSLPTCWRTHAGGEDSDPTAYRTSGYQAALLAYPLGQRGPNTAISGDVLCPIFFPLQLFHSPLSLSLSHASQKYACLFFLSFFLFLLGFEREIGIKAGLSHPLEK